eukprot:1147128-Pelagomonas_calceolata.AAC.2
MAGMAACTRLVWQKDSKLCSWHSLGVIHSRVVVVPNGRHGSLHSLEVVHCEGRGKASAHRLPVLILWGCQDALNVIA